MYCKDFEYDGQRLSDFGGVVCHITDDACVSTISIGSHIKFNKIPIVGVNKFKLTSAQYDESYTTTFEIGKFNCKDPDDNTFTPEEVSHFMRWLNKKDEFKKFKMIYKDGELADVYYNASFNIEPIRCYGDIIGLKLTMETDAPFAYYDEIEYTMEFTEDKLNHSFFDTSDEIGYIYPSTMTIEMLGDGDLEMVNSQEPDRITSIKNCIKGEIITLVGNLFPSSSEVHDGLYNDFNYVFPRICNENKDIYGYGYSIDNMENVFTVNIPCKITFNYSPICKMGIV